MVWGRGPEDDGAPPYWAWRAVLRGAASLAGSELVSSSPVVRRALDAIDGDRDGEGGGGGDVPGPRGEGEARFAVFDGVTRFLRVVSDEAGLLVVLDDLHGTDRPSQQLLAHLVRDLTPSRLLIVATYRDTDPGVEATVAALARSPVTRRIPLTGFDAAQVRQALASAAGAPVAVTVAEQVHELTGGNPLFVTELAGVGWGAALPASLRAVIEGRVQATSPACREMVRAAAVLGRTFPVRVLRRMLEMSETDRIAADEEARAAGLLEPGPGPGDARFVHALVRDAVEAGLAPKERAGLHAAGAAALEEVHAGRLEPVLSDIARHRIAATVVAGPTDRLAAVGWTERAARAARARLADAEAARLFTAALEHGGTDLDAEHRTRLMLDRATALQRAGEVAEAGAATEAAFARARRAGRAELQAEAALVLPCLPTLEWERAAWERCGEALAVADGLPTSLRARLLARRAEAGMYVDELPAADTASLEAVGLAGDGDDPVAAVAALRARALVRSDPGGIDDRAELADRMLAIGHRRRDIAVEVAARSWRVDVLFAHGDLAGVAAELEQLAWCTDEAGPLARWWLWLYRGTLAQARGDLTDSREHIDQADKVIAPVGHPGAFPIAMSLRMAIDRHQGADPDAEHVRACRSSGPGSAATPGHAFRIMDLLGPAVVLAQAGLLDQAAAKFRAIGPVGAWRLPPYHLLPLAVMGIDAGIRLDAPHEVAGMAQLLEGHRGRHAVSGKDVTYYCGPVELALGRAAAFRGRLDDAAGDLERATEIARECGAAGFAVEAAVHLADVLARRAAAGDRTRAREMVTAARLAAEQRGMRPLLSELDRVGASLGIAGPADLTHREREIAQAVAHGLTNRQIADDLVLSERTVENHVQHVLTKLGVASRHHVAARLHT